jgi:hypothetical protein
MLDTRREPDGTIDSLHRKYPGDGICQAEAAPEVPAFLGNFSRPRNFPGLPPISCMCSKT